MKIKSHSTLATNAFWLSVGQGMRLLVQAAYFAVIARSLGTANYGAFIGVSAIVGIAYPFGSLGSGNIMIKQVARDPAAFRSAWGFALLRTMILGSALVGLIVLGSHLALPPEIPRRLILVVALSDILGLNVILLSALAFQAVERMKWTSFIFLMISASRLAAALVLISLHPHPTALQWGYAYLASTALVAVLAFCLVAVQLGAPKFEFHTLVRDLREGFYFAASLSAQTVYNDLDKTMLVRLGTLEATGIYGAAYRLIEVAFSPVLALLGAAYPNFFRVGVRGIRASITYARPLLVKSLLFSVVICIGLILSAGLIPMVLGKQFAASTQALRWLAFILPLRSTHAFLSDILTSANRQGLRTSIQVGIAIFNGVINLWMIPAYSWKGAAVSSLISDALLALSMAWAVWIVVKKSDTQSPISPGEKMEAIA